MKFNQKCLKIDENQLNSIKFQSKVPQNWGKLTEFNQVSMKFNQKCLKIDKNHLNSMKFNQNCLKIDKKIN